MKAIYKSNSFNLLWSFYHNSTRLPFDFTGKEIEVWLISDNYKELLQNYTVRGNVIESEIETDILPFGPYSLMCRYKNLEEQAYISSPNAFHVVHRPEYAPGYNQAVVLESYVTLILPSAVLEQFNSLFVKFIGTPYDTRNNIPIELRRPGLIITYINNEGEVITERSASDSQKENLHWGLDVNWSRIDELSLSGEISVSTNGTWILNGKDSGIQARGPKGDTGLTPWLKTIDNKLHFSYDNVTWEPCSDYIAHYFRIKDNKIQISADNSTWTTISDYIAHYFRVNENKLQISADKTNWETVSDYIASWFRIYDNKLEISRDNKVTWEQMSDSIAAWFRWQATTGDTQANNVGRLQISRDEGKTWTNLSNDIINNLHISKYIGTDETLPTSGVTEGTIYAKGPTYAEDDAELANPIYRLWVYAWKGDTLAWHDNGEFTSIAAGVVQETGNSETEVMSQKIVSEELHRLNSKGTIIAPTLQEVNYLPINKGLINSSNIWNINADATHTTIKVKSGDSVVIQSDSKTSTFIAFLKEYNPINGKKCSIVGSSSVITTVSAVGGKEYIVPEDANYLYIEMSREGVDASFVLFTYNGINLLESHAHRIEQNASDLQDFKNTIRGSVYKNSDGSDSVSNATRMLDKMSGIMGAITYENKWSKTADGTAYHVVIPVYKGDKIYISSSSSVTSIAFVKSYTTPVYGKLLDMSEIDGFTKRITTTNAGKEYIVPEDVKYLIVVVYADGTIYTFNEFSINGISLLKDNMSSLIKELSITSEIARPLYKDYKLKDCVWIQGYHVKEQPDKPAPSNVRISIEDYLPVIKGITYNIVNAEDYNIHVTFYNENKEFQSNPIYFTADYTYSPSTDGYIRIGIQPIDGSTITPSDMESTNMYVHSGLFETITDNKSNIASLSTALGREDIVIDMNEDYYLDNRYIIAETGKIVSYDSSTYRIKKVDVNKGDLIKVRAYAGGAVSIISIDFGGDEYLSVVQAVPYKTTDYVYTAEKNCTIAVSFTKGESNLLYITRLSNINGGNSNENSSVNLSDKVVINDQEYLNIAYSSIGLAPINTAEHYIMAAHCGFNAAKADIEITSDNVLVCCHDTGFTFDADGRITTYNSSNATLIHDMTWEAVSKLEYAAKSALLGYYAKVCTIDKYLRICKENGLIPFITVRSVNTDLVLEQLFPMIRKYFLESVAIINLFPPSMEKVQKVRAYSKTIKICYTQNYGGDLSATLIANVAANKPAYIAIESNRVSNDTNMSLIPTANEYGIRCISYDTTESYYRDMQLRGITGFAIIRPILPYKPKRITFQLSLDNAGDTLVFRNRESNLLTADVSIDKSAMIVTIKNIKKKYSDYGFVDGLMPALMNMLPYNINVVSRSRKDRAIEVYWEDDSIKLALKSLSADLFEFSIDV